VSGYHHIATGADLTWPGVDRDRALAACWHLERAAWWLQVFRCRRPMVPRTVTLRWEKNAREHLRIAVGFLGAVGFEHGAGLYRR